VDVELNAKSGKKYVYIVNKTKLGKKDNYFFCAKFNEIEAHFDSSDKTQRL
jgi:hypothetical protein